MPKKYEVQFFSPEACQWEFEEEFFMKKEAVAWIQKAVDEGFDPRFWRIIVVISFKIKPPKK